eukprot:4475038-Amphidinium_carterae.1
MQGRPTIGSHLKKHSKDVHIPSAMIASGAQVPCSQCAERSQTHRALLGGVSNLPSTGAYHWNLEARGICSEETKDALVSDSKTPRYVAQLYRLLHVIHVLTTLY